MAVKAGPNQKRAAKRLARVRVTDSKSLPGVQPNARGRFNRDERYQILHAVQALSAKRQADKKAAANKPKPFDPLAPLSGAGLENEVQSRANLQFGGQETELKNALSSNSSERELASSAYDQYRTALIDATARVNAQNAAAAKSTQDAVDTSYTQGTAAVNERETALKERMAKIGQQADPNAAQNGQLAVEGARSQGNQAAAATRTQGASTNAMMEGEQANALLGKTEALAKRDATKQKLLDAGTDLKKQRGEFAVSERGKIAADERTYDLARSEFGLKTKATNADIAATKAKTKADKKSSNAQVIVARIYAAADQAQARAQVRVAKLQLEKGKIDQHQYRTIVNTYKGLPKKGKAPEAKDPGKQGSGSGVGGTLAPWEVDARDKAFTGFGKNKYTRSDHARAITKAVQAGIPKRLAESAWKRYVKTLHSGTNVAPDGGGGQRPT